MDDRKCSSDEIKYAVFNDRFLLTCQFEEANPIARLLYALHECIVFLCEIIKTSVDHDGQAKEFVVYDEEGPLNTWGVASCAVSGGFDHVTQFLQANEPELLTCIEGARCIYAVMLDSALRTAQRAVLVKGIDCDAESRKFHLEQKRLAFDLEKAAAPILLAANGHRGKPFQESKKGPGQPPKHEHSITKMKNLLGSPDAFKAMPLTYQKDKWEWLAKKIDFHPDAKHTAISKAIQVFARRKLKNTEYTKLKAIMEQN